MCATALGHQSINSDLKVFRHCFFTDVSLSSYSLTLFIYITNHFDAVLAIDKFKNSKTVNVTFAFSVVDFFELLRKTTILAN